MSQENPQMPHFLLRKDLFHIDDEKSESKGEGKLLITQAYLKIPFPIGTNPGGSGLLSLIVPQKPLPWRRQHLNSDHGHKPPPGHLHT